MKRKRARDIEPGTIILVRWFDAWRNADEYGSTEDVAKQAARLELDDVGFFVALKDGYLVMSEERSTTHEDFRHIHRIPQCNVISIMVVEE